MGADVQFVGKNGGTARTHNAIEGLIRLFDLAHSRLFVDFAQ
jgi:hypothetical protein